MVGGRARSRSPRELADDPENWPHADLSGHVAAAVVQSIAATLQAVMAERGLTRAAHAFALVRALSILPILPLPVAGQAKSGLDVSPRHLVRVTLGNAGATVG